MKGKPDMKLLNLTLSILIILSAPAFAAKDTNAPGNKPEDKIPDVNTIVTKANHVAYYQAKDGKAKVNMQIINKEGQIRQRQFVIIRKDVNEAADQKYFVYFDRPPDVRRMVYMVHKHVALDKDDDRWLYMPALDLIKRIAASDKRTSFVGSHYLYEDVSGRSLALDRHTLSDVNDKFFVVDNVPKIPDLVKFSHYKVHIDRKTYMPVKIEYFDKKNDKLYRTIEVKKVEKIQDFPTAVESVVHDLETGGKTIMKYSDVQYNIGVGDIFTERYMRRPPREVRR